MMRSAGFSLIEMLVVITIGAVLAMMVMLRLGAAGGGEEPLRQLQRLAALVEQQCDQAMFQARPRGLRLTARGYDFWQLADGQWQPLADTGPGRARTWQGQALISLRVEGHVVGLNVERPAPQIVCQPLGELTQFELELAAAGQPSARLSGFPAGRLEYRPLP